MSVPAHVQYRPASITVVRHGQSVTNFYDPESTAHVPPDLVGTPNHKIELTELGHRQARATGAALPSLCPDGFDRLYFSPYQRTVQTKDGILAGMPAEYRARIGENMYRDILLREQDFGYADPMAALEQTAAHFDEARRRFLAHRENAGKFYTRPDNGDSWADVCQRTYMFIGKVFRPTATAPTSSSCPTPSPSRPSRSTSSGSTRKRS